MMQWEQLKAVLIPQKINSFDIQEKDCNCLM